jgi:hypothetical protein
MQVLITLNVFGRLRSFQVSRFCQLVSVVKVSNCDGKSNVWGVFKHYCTAKYMWQSLFSLNRNLINNYSQAILERGWFKHEVV